MIHPDILTYPHEKVSQHVEQGKDLLADLFALEQIRKNVPDYDIVLHTSHLKNLFQQQNFQS